MTCFAGAAFRTGMLIIFLVAAHTSCGSIFILVGHGMTAGASQIFMFADQFEAGHGMIKMGILPAFLGMAGITGGAKFVSVRVIL